MATPGMMVGTMAELMGISEVYMGAYDRELAKNGLRSKSGRGTSAARMGSDDATNLLLAVMSGGQAKEAAQSVRTYANLTPKFQKLSVTKGREVITTVDYRSGVDSLGFGIQRVDALPVRHGFGEIIEALIFAAHSGELESAVGTRTAETVPGGMRAKGTWELAVRVMSPIPVAELSFGFDEMMTTYVYSQKDPFPVQGDLVHSTSISQDTILGLGRLLRE
jgi:hypothetical protein